MPGFTGMRALLGALLLVLSAAVSAQLTLQPVLSGLQEPRFVTHAGDGSRRLFFVQKDGQVLVLAPGATTATVFLNLQGLVGSADEGGLLGLAFHPGYRSNGRLFVFYTRVDDNALVVAEHQVTGNPNVAQATGLPLLVIPHPDYTNHNGGMLAFGGDGHLYIGTGDGGGANDPSNNAQDVDSLLGKILRIDVDRSVTPYAVPADNPYVGKTGRDEIFSIGWRNPWRFSFDRSTQQLWVGDVGQDRWEEINAPVVNGGNYGWPAYEGKECIRLGECNFRRNRPVHQYDHQNGRCSITGGYVYRGTAGVLPSGDYIFGDFCTGEVFAWAREQRTLLTVAQYNLVSFGEDEQGELYVVERNGSVSRLVSTADCSLSINPIRVSFGSAGGDGVLRVDVLTGCHWTAISDASWVTLTPPNMGNGSAEIAYTVAPHKGKNRVATLTVNGQTLTITQSR